MSLSAVLVLNAILVGALLATLTYVCLTPFRLDRAARPEELRLTREASHTVTAEERAAA